VPAPSRSLLIAELKRTLREQGLTYAQVARELKLSLPTIKRMFSREDFTLRRFERICDLAGCSLADIAARAHERSTPVRQLTLAQEKQIVSDPKLLLVTWLVLNRATLEQIVRDYRLTEREVLAQFIRLDRLKVIELQPGNRARLLISRHFSWRPGGPVQRYIYEKMLQDFLSSNFAGPDEEFWFHGSQLSDASMEALKRALHAAARECAVIVDGEKAATRDRRGAAFVLALRRWSYSGFAPFERT
jgi:transcriptional regulator with XRE-family HTH domain